MRALSKISLATLLVAGSLNAAQYAPDVPHSNIAFAVKHLKITDVHGVFKGYDALIDYDKATNELKAFEATLQAASIDTRVEPRDNHLKSEDFFDAQKFPTIKFKMTKFEKDGKNEGKIYGDLTIKNITKPVVLDFNYNGESKNMNGEERIGIELDGEIFRRDFGVGEKFLDSSISDKIELNIDIEAGPKK